MPSPFFISLLSAALSGEPPLPTFGSYWRIRFRGAPPAGNTQFSEVFFYAGGVDLCSGGTVIKSAELDGTTWAAVNAFDRNTGTNWAAGSAYGGRDAWIGYHFASDVVPDEIGFTASAAFPNQNGVLFAVEYSSDGVTWHLYALSEDLAGGMGSGDHREFSLTPIVLDAWDTDPHRHWRLLFVMNGGDSYQTLQEIELFDSPGGINLTDTYGFTPSTNNAQGGYPISNAFDNSSSQWYTNSTANEIWVAVDFGSGNEYSVGEVQVTASTGDGYRCPSSFILQYSDDGSTWVNREYFPSPAVYGNSETRVFEVGLVSAGGPALWRMFVEATFAYDPVDNEYTGLRYIGMAETIGGADKIDAALYLTNGSGSTAETEPATNAFRGAGDTTIATIREDVNGEQWFKWNFPSPGAAIEELRVRPRDGFQSQYPRRFSLQYFDGADWQQKFAKDYSTDPTFVWYANKIFSFTEDDKPADPGKASHQYWRLRVNTFFDSSWICIAKCKFYSDTAMTTAISTTSATFDASQTSEDNAAAAFGSGKIVGAHGSAAFTPPFAWALEVKYASAVTAKGFSMFSRDAFGQAPLDMSIDYSDDGQNWYVAWDIPTQSAWSTDEERFFADPDP